MYIVTPIPRDSTLEPSHIRATPDQELDRATMIVAAMVLIILGGIAFARIVNTLATLADAPALAKRPLSKFLIAFFFIWAVEAFLIGSVSVLWAGLQTFAGDARSANATTANVSFGLTAWMGGMVSSGLATLLSPRFDDDTESCGSSSRHPR